jgi:glutamine cyclotransferase
MKKYIVVILIVLVGGTLLVYPLLKDDGIEEIDQKPPAVFGFKDNLAANDGDVVPIQIQINEPVQKLELIYYDSLLKTWDNVSSNKSFDFEAGMFGVGTRGISLTAYLKNGEKKTDSRLVRVLSDIVPEKLTVEIVEDYPHNPMSFTQGLEFHNGDLYEGTGDPGNQGATLVAKVDLATGNHLEKMGLSPGFFGEGITIIDTVLYQLTYKQGRCYTYGINSKLQLQDEFNYQGEGWGLCNDGESLIMSNGTERLAFRDPKTFSLVKNLEVYNNEGPVTNLNELEFIDGLIYANVWTSNLVVVIDPSNGKVLKEIDATLLGLTGRGSKGEVLNGIAYNKVNRKIYMTGKYWEKLFEVVFKRADA